MVRPINREIGVETRLRHSQRVPPGFRFPIVVLYNATSAPRVHPTARVFLTSPRPLSLSPLVPANYSSTLFQLLILYYLLPSMRILI